MASMDGLLTPEYPIHGTLLVDSYASIWDHDETDRDSTRGLGAVSFVGIAGEITQETAAGLTMRQVARKGM